jgi:hypothetical protein
VVQKTAQAIAEISSVPINWIVKLEKPQYTAHINSLKQTQNKHGYTVLAFEQCQHPSSE